MPRRNRPARPADSDGRGGSVFPGERTESWRGESYRVRAISGAGSTAPYRCPGCDQLLAAGTAHVVVWPERDLDAEDRRHWHSSCWLARHRRQPGVQRSRNAPRYG